MGRQKRLTNELRSVLETGSDALGYFSPRLSPKELKERLREPWRRFGARVTRDFMKRHGPGERPWGFWTYDAPEPRFIAPPPDGDKVRTWEESDLLQSLFDQALLIKHGLLAVSEQKTIERQNLEFRRLLESSREEAGDAVPENLPKEMVN